MKKIPTIFERDEADRRYVTDRPNPACDWVFAGEGWPTRKYDGTCVALLDLDGARQWVARREVKPGKSRPAGFIEVDHDPITGKTVGWEPIEQSAYAKYHAEALNAANLPLWPCGTYELIGPKVNGNPERVASHELWAHAAAPILPDGLRTFDAIRLRVLAEAEKGAEGIVFHHPDGRMAKIKARDFREETTTR